MTSRRCLCVRVIVAGLVVTAPTVFPEKPAADASFTTVQSTTETRFKRCAQVRGAVGGSMRSVEGSAGCCCWVADAVAESLSFLRWRALAGVDTIARRMGELGAKTPW